MFDDHPSLPVGFFQEHFRVRSSVTATEKIIFNRFVQLWLTELVQNIELLYYSLQHVSSYVLRTKHPSEHEKLFSSLFLYTITCSVYFDY